MRTKIDNGKSVILFHRSYRKLPGSIAVFLLQFVCLAVLAAYFYPQITRAICLITERVLAPFYLPRMRIDNNFNFKFGPENRLVGSVGGSYIQNFDDHKDYIVSAGLIAYLKNSVAEYRIFRNQSDPGSVESYSHLMSLGYGQDKQQWTTATFASGRQAYLATYLAMPQEVNQNSRMVALNHRRWLGNGNGFFGDISYLELENAYNKTGFSLGFFREF